MWLSSLNPRILVFLLGLVFLPQISFAAEVVYSGDKPPQEEGWGVGGGTGLILNNGILTIRNPGGYGFVQKDDPEFSNSVGTTVEARLKVSVEEGVGTISLRDGSRIAGVSISQGNMQFGEKTIYRDGRDFHTYRVTLKGNEAKLYVDGVLAATITPSIHWDKTLYFGVSLGTNSPYRQSEWDYFGYTTKGVFAPDSCIFPTTLPVETMLTAPSSIKTLAATEDFVLKDFELGDMKCSTSEPSANIYAPYTSDLSPAKIDFNLNSIPLENTGKVCETKIDPQYCVSWKVPTKGIYKYNFDATSKLNNKFVSKHYSGEMCLESGCKNYVVNFKSQNNFELPDGNNELSLKAFMPGKIIEYGHTVQVSLIYPTVYPVFSSQFFMPEEKISLDSWTDPYDYNYYDEKSPGTGSNDLHTIVEHRYSEDKIAGLNKYKLDTYLIYRVLVKPDGSEELIDKFKFNNKDWTSKHLYEPKAEQGIYEYFSEHDLPENVASLQRVEPGNYKVEVRMIRVPALTAEKYPSADIDSVVDLWDGNSFAQTEHKIRWEDSRGNILDNKNYINYGCTPTTKEQYSATNSFSFFVLKDNQCQNNEMINIKYLGCNYEYTESKRDYYYTFEPRIGRYERDIKSDSKNCWLEQITKNSFALKDLSDFVVKYYYIQNDAGVDVVVSEGEDISATAGKTFSLALPSADWEINKYNNSMVSLESVYDSEAIFTALAGGKTEIILNRIDGASGKIEIQKIKLKIESALEPDAAAINPFAMMKGEVAERDSGNSDNSNSENPFALAVFLAGLGGAAAAISLAPKSFPKIKEMVRENFLTPVSRIVNPLLKEFNGRISLITKSIKESMPPGSYSKIISRTTPYNYDPPVIDDVKLPDGTILRNGMPIFVDWKKTLPVFIPEQKLPAKAASKEDNFKTSAKINSQPTLQQKLIADNSQIYGMCIESKNVDKNFLERVAVHGEFETDIGILKKVGFVRDYLGIPKGSDGMYRVVTDGRAFQARVFGNKVVVESDAVDPYSDPIGHLNKDLLPYAENRTGIPIGNITSDGTKYGENLLREKVRDKLEELEEEGADTTTPSVILTLYEELKNKEGKNESSSKKILDLIKDEAKKYQKEKETAATEYGKVVVKQSGNQINEVSKQSREQKLGFIESKTKGPKDMTTGPATTGTSSFISTPIGATATVGVTTTATAVIFATTTSTAATAGAIGCGITLPIGCVEGAVPGAAIGAVVGFIAGVAIVLIDYWYSNQKSSSIVENKSTNGTNPLTENRTLTDEDFKKVFGVDPSKSQAMPLYYDRDRSDPQNKMPDK